MKVKLKNGVTVDETDVEFVLEELRKALAIGTMKAARSFLDLHANVFGCGPVPDLPGCPLLDPRWQCISQI